MITDIKLNIVGAGFVGLSLAEALSRNKYVHKITVIDVNETKINNLKYGIIDIKEPDLTLNSYKINYTHMYSETDGDIYFVCVGTPNDETGVQNISYVLAAVEDICNFNPNAIIILKSTILPENISKIREIIPSTVKFMTNPEFLAEGSAVHDVLNQHIIVIGCDKELESYAIELFHSIFYKMIPIQGVSVLRVDEAMVVKYFLNIYKPMKLTFINEMATYCMKSGMSINRVLRVVNDDPVMGRGFDKPGIGFGGSCFPKDLIAFKENSKLAVEVCVVNFDRIANVHNFIISKFDELKKSNPKILIAGKAFKKGTNDTRESVGFIIGTLLSNIPGYNIKYYDENPELTDYTYDELIELKDNFDLVLVVNEYPELESIFKDSKSGYWDTRNFEIN